MKKTAEADIVIFGGGIAGLWLLSRLRQLGLTVILFESASLGGGQTHKAQGIIHGGMKYALQGVMTNEAQTISEMPDRWRTCLAGTGEIDLSAVPVLSNQHYLWSPNKFTAKLANLFASATLACKVNSLNATDYPAVFQHPHFKGDVFALDEIVLDVPSLVRELVKKNQDVLFKIEPVCGQGLKLATQEDKVISATVSVNGQSIEVIAQHFIFTAGAGNEVVAQRLKQHAITMQRRPLHMVLVKMPQHYTLYAHCLGIGARPRITITTHQMQNGSNIWYLGGQLAEDGINRDSQQQIKAAKAELQALFPWLDFTAAEFATFMVDRAEPLQKNGFKPESYYNKTIANMTIAWPTKLALAPLLADDIIQQLKTLALVHQLRELRELRCWPMPPVAKPIWEDMFCKDVA